MPESKSELIDPNDFQAFEPRAKEVIVELRDFSLLRFDALDGNKDGFLSREELLGALYEPGCTVRERAFLNFLLVRIREIAASYHEDGQHRPDCISLHDLREYFARLLGETVEVH